MEESKQEKLLNAIFGADEPKPKSLRFSLNLEDVVVDVVIKKTKKNEANSCSGSCSGGCKCGGRK